MRERLRALVASYRKTLQSDRRHLLDHFTLADIAHKVVGVGSVGTRAWILLFEAGVEAEALLLQAKEALDRRPSPLRRRIGVQQRRRARGRRSTPHASIE